MKFCIKDNPISYDEIYGSIRRYAKENQGKWPSYILLHPETRDKIIISERDAEQGLNYRVITHSFSQEKPVMQMFGLDLIRSYDVEPGFIIICG